MSIRRILVPVNGQEIDFTLLKTALSTAKKLNAHVDALFVRAEPTEYLPVMGEGYSGMVAQDIIDAVEKAADDMAVKAHEHAKTMAEREGVSLVSYGEATELPSIAFHQTKGPVLSVLQEESQLTDLIVCAKPTPGLGTDMGNVLPDLLIGSRRPFLITPEAAPEQIGRHVVIAWNGGSEAASAVRQARGFLPVAEKIEVVIVSDDEKNGRAEIARPIAYLAYHGIKAEARVITGKARGSGETLMAYAEEQGADLLIMGAYGRSRVREFIFGGATRKVLQEAKMPVFMAH